MTKNSKNDDLKLDFWFLHLIKNYECLQNDQAEKYSGLQATRNARKLT